MVTARITYLEGDQAKMTRLLRFKSKQHVWRYVDRFYPTCVCVAFISSLRKRIKFFLLNLRYGLKFGYPICCILHYCLDGLIAVPSALMRYSDRTQYVECAYHVKRNGGVQPFPIA